MTPVGNSFVKRWSFAYFCMGGPQQSSFSQTPLRTILCSTQQLYFADFTFTLYLEIYVTLLHA